MFLLPFKVAQKPLKSRKALPRKFNLPLIIKILLAINSSAMAYGALFIMAICISVDSIPIPLYLANSNLEVVEDATEIHTGKLKHIVLSVLNSSVSSSTPDTEEFLAKTEQQ